MESRIQTRGKTVLRVLPLTLYELGYYQSNEENAVEVELEEGKPEPPRVRTGEIRLRHKPRCERHRGTFVAGLASVVPIDAEQYGLKTTQRGGRRGAEDVTKYVPLAHARTKDLYRRFVPRPSKREFKQLEDWWTHLTGRRIDLRSVFATTSPNASSLNNFDRATQWKIGNRAVGTGKFALEKMKRDASECGCPREECECETETLQHLFFECPIAQGVWRWAARTLRRCTDEDITSAQPAVGATRPLLRLDLRFDGSSRHAREEGRGPGGGGALLTNADTGKLVWIGCEHLPSCTVNEGEWRGLRLGLRAAAALNAHEVNVIGDSKLVLNQISGEWDVKCDNLRADYEECRSLLSRAAHVTFTHTRRRWNTAADYLANRAADGGTHEVWIGGVKPSPTAEKEGRHRDGRSELPDMATCLLGVKPHAFRATLDKPVDWFQVLRLSILGHLYDTRNEARAGGRQANAGTIKRKVARDFIKRVQLRWVAGKKMGRLKMETVLRHHTTPGECRSSDFADISGW